MSEYNNSEWYKSILNSMKDMVLVKGPKSKLVWANKAFLDFYGMTESELKDIVDAPHSDPDNTLQYVIDDQKVFSTKLHLNIPQEPVTNSEGITKQFHTIKSPIFKDGEVHQIVILSREKTSFGSESTTKKRNESKTISSALRSLAHNFPLPMLLVDIKKRIVSHNSFWKENFGKVDDSQNLFFDELYTELSAVSNGISESIQTNKKLEQTIEFNNKYYNFNISPWKYSDGTIGGANVIATDITTLIQQEKALQDINERYQLSLDSSGIGVWDFNIINNHMVWDKYMYKIYGIDEKDFTGAYAAWRTLVHPDDIESSENTLLDSLKTGNDFSIKFRIKQKNKDEVKHIQSKAIVIKDENGEAVRMLGVNWDITDQIKTQNKLSNAKLLAERALTARSRFLANMSHEIRTPLNGIISCANLLIDFSNNDNQRELINTINKCGDSLLEIINDILDFSKIEAQKITLNKDTFNIRKTLDNIINLLLPKASESSVYLNLNIDDAIPDWIIGDEMKIQQVLINLIGNGIKFAKSRVEIILTSHKLSGDNYRLQFQVNDDGIGIPLKAQKELFQSFSQVDASTTRKFGGTGLGLAISKGLVEAMGGDINVDSEIDKGAYFYFTIKVKKGKKKVQESKITLLQVDKSFAKQFPNTILLAEDNSVNQMVARKYLERLGYSVDLAADGKEVLDAMEKRSYDIIFMDQHMPVMDGVEATINIRKSKLFKNQPRIIALTASIQDEDRKKCLDAGMNAFLSKPINLEALIQQLQEN